MHRPRRLPLVAVALLAAACGSTVQSTTQVTTGTDATTGGLGGSASGALPGTTSGGGTGVGGTTGSGTGGSSGAGGSSGGTGGVTGGGTTAGAASGGGSGGSGGSSGLGPGITATEIKLGIPYCNDCAAANGALGAGQQDPGDTRRYYQAVLDDVNSRGGVLGRKLTAVFHPISAADNLDTSAQAACERWTNDTQVAGMFFRGDVVAKCALEAGVLAMGGGGTGPVYEKFPNLYAPSSIPLEGLYGATVNAMVKAGWHKPAPAWPTGKIGLITWDTPEYRYAMTNGYLKSLHAAGLKEEDVRYISVPQNAGSIAEASAAIGSAVLAFQGRGIDHVFIGDGPSGIFAGTGLTLLFLQGADSQNYYPRYGFNTNNSPDFANHPKRQLVGMIAIDSQDENEKKDVGIAKNPQRDRCYAIMRADLTQNLAVNACEIGWFAEAVFAKSGGSSLSRVTPGAQALGTSYRSPQTYGTRFAGGKRYGVYLFRNLAYDSGCSCLKYTSLPYEP